MNPIKAIPPFKLVPSPLNRDAESLPKFKWAANNIGTRHQLGGDPEYIQSIEWPTCPSCNEKMNFYAQLDSINDDFQIADCGMIYVFFCFDCNESISLVQSY